MSKAIKFDFDRHTPAIFAIPAIQTAENSGIAEIASHPTQNKAAVPDENSGNSKIANPAHDNSIVTEAMTCSRADNLAEVRAWLTYIGEDDEAIIDEVIGHCQDDADSMAYFLKRSHESKEK